MTRTRRYDSTRGRPAGPLIAVLGFLLAGPAAATQVELAAGERHVEPLPPGERPVMVVVEQQGVDVVATVRDAAGRTLVSVDGPGGRRGPEWLLVPEGGVEVELRGAGGAGRVGLDVAVVEGPSAAGRLAFVRAAGAAGERYLEGDRDGALDGYRRALEAGGGGARERSWIAYATGVLERETGRPTAASTLEAARRGLAAAGDIHGEARAANDLGLVLWQEGRASEALAPLEDSLALRRRAGDAHGVVQSLANLGLARLAAGDLRGAEDALRQAVDRAPAAEDAGLEAAVAQNLGGVYLRRGELSEARSAFERALEVYRREDDPHQQAKAWLNLAVTFRRAGEWLEAEAGYARALELLRRLDAPRTEAAARNNLGVLLLDRGQADAARSEIQAALDLRRRAGDERGEATALDNLGQCLAALGRFEAARDAYETALALRRELGDLRGEAASLDHLGRLLADRGALAEAHRRLTAALALRRRAGDVAGEARTLRRLGELAVERGEPGAATEVLGEALALARRIEDRDEEAWILHALAEAELRRGRPEAALEHLEGAMDRVEALRPLSGGDEPRSYFLAARRRIFSRALDLLLELHRRDPGKGFDRRAFEVSERSRARSLLDLLAEAGARPERAVAPELAERRRRLRADLLAKSERRTVHLARGEGEEAAFLRQEVERLASELRLVEADLRERSAGFAALGRPLSADEVQALLPPGVLLLELALGAERSALWSVDRDGVEVHELPPASRLEPLARDLLERYARREVGRDDGAAPRAEELSRRLLGPVAEELAEGRSLLLVPDGALHGFPLAALPAPPGAAGEGRPLLDERSVALLPSASVLGAVRADRSSAPWTEPWTAAVLADPSLDPTFAPLAGGRREAALIASLLPPGAVSSALGAEASRGFVLEGGLRGRRLVHVATHAVVEPRNPWLSGLLLAQREASGRERAGFLGLAELYGLHLDAELVVLSGCGTMQGARVAGEGLMGLARGFLHAGARNVVSTLWPVEDATAAAFADRFYPALLERGLPPAEALREAQRGLRRDPRFRDPYHWAVFVLQGVP